MKLRRGQIESILQHAMELQQACRSAVRVPGLSVTKRDVSAERWFNTILYYQHVMMFYMQRTIGFCWLAHVLLQTLGVALYAMTSNNGRLIAIFSQNIVMIFYRLSLVLGRTLFSNLIL